MQAKQELMQLKERLSQQIAVLQSELTTVDKAIQLLEREHNSAATGTQDKRFRNVGLSDACRQTVNAEWTSPTEVRNQLLQGGFKSTDKNKLLAAVFATLKRLAIRELEAKRIDGKMKYRKRQPAAVAIAAVEAA